VSASTGEGSEQLGATPDVLVVGGGVIGMSVAWRAAQGGLRVCVAEPEPGRGASHAAAGLLMPSLEAAGRRQDLFRLGRESLRRYPAFAAELTAATGAATGFRQDGTLEVGYQPADLAVVAERHRLRRSLGGDVRQLSGGECRQAEPALDPAVSGGLLAADDGSVDPRLLIRALLAAAVEAGVRHVRQPASEILTEGGRAAGARLADGSEIRAGSVVLAAGWQSAAIPGPPEAAVPPVRPVKGQVLRLRGGAGGRPVLVRPVRGIVRGRVVYLVPRDGGELVIGATQEELGADIRVTAGGVWELLRDALVLVPGIAGLEFAEAVAGLRPGTPDGAPILGPSALPGLLLATGHFRSGVLLAPVTADIIADYLVSRRLPELGRGFAADRFRRGAAAHC
jgi:glycine oxidase